MSWLILKCFVSGGFSIYEAHKIREKSSDCCDFLIYIGLLLILIGLILI